MNKVSYYVYETQAALRWDNRQNKQDYSSTGNRAGISDKGERTSGW